MEAYDEFLKLAKTLKVMDTTYYISGDFAPGQRFMKGECAFYYTGFSSCCFYKMFDQMEDDYGIIPWPMGDTNYKNEKQYYSMYPHLNPYCVFRNNQPGANIKGAVQMLCELYTPIYDTDSEDAKTLYQSEIDQFSRDDESAKNLDMLEQRKTHFRVFMYSGAPCIIGDAQQIQDVLFGKGEDAILDQTTTAKAYFESIAAAINNAIYKRSPYTWK